MSTHSRLSRAQKKENPFQPSDQSTHDGALLIESITDYAIFMLDPHGYVISWNAGAERLKGYHADEIIGQHFSRFYPQEDVTRGKPAMELRIAVDSGRFEEEGWRVRKDGSLFRANVIITAMLDETGKLRGFSKITRDITQRYRAEEALRNAEEKYRRIFEDSVTGIFQTTPDGKYLSVNPALARLFGYDSPAELMASRAEISSQGYVNPRDREMFKSKLNEMGSISNFEYQAYRKDGSKIWLMENARMVRDSSGAPLYYEGTLMDITDRKVAEERVLYLAYYDVLTGLPNRTLMLDRLTKALANARRRKDRVALLYLDLDRFKYVNDSFGHSHGDLLLQSIGKRLASVAREQDTVARISGDEFLIILAGIKDPSEAAIAGTRFLDAMAVEFEVEDQCFSVTCSLGISIFPEHGADSETLIKNADWALHAAKDRGRNNLQFFSEDMNAKASEQLTLGNGLRTAVEKRELFLAYQPQMDIDTGRTVGLEALLRWRHPELGLIAPDKFIPIAESSGLIVSIGEWVLRAACSQVRNWQVEGLPVVPVAVNVSAVQFRQRGFVDLVARVLQETGLPPHYLELELTESLLLSTGDVTFSVLKELSALGLKLAIDDFGTGYSSLSYLKYLPVSKLKIDRSFVENIATNSDDAAIAATIISIAKQLHLEVIAEGVESEAQLSFLRLHECDQIQGYYFSKPLSVDAMAEHLRFASLRPLSGGEKVL